MFKWVISAAKHISASLEGKSYTVAPSHPSYEKLEDAARNQNADEFKRLVDIPAAVTEYGQGHVKVVGGAVYYGSHLIQNSLTERILDCMNKSIPADAFIKFLENLMQNPSKRAIQETYTWLEHQCIPITTDGFWLGYKAIKADWTDKYTGAVDNHIGQTPTMPRSLVDDNWGVACSEGYHVGNAHYARGFADSEDRIVLVKVNPKDVVSVPSEDINKCRVCCYQVLYEVTRDFAPLEWPVYTMNADGTPMPVTGVSRVYLNPVTPPKAETSTYEGGKDKNEEDGYEDDEDDKYYEVHVTLTCKSSAGILSEMDEVNSEYTHEEVNEENYDFDIVYFPGFTDRDEAESFACEMDELPYVDHTDVIEVDENGDPIKEPDATVEKKESTDDLPHLSTQQRYELRQRAIETLLETIADTAERARRRAEIQVEAMTRRQMAELLPPEEQQKYTDPNYKPQAKDFFPISFEVFDGDIAVGKHSVRTEEEEKQVMEMCKQVYMQCEQHNRVDSRIRPDVT